MSAQVSIISQAFMLKPFGLTVLHTLHTLTSKQKKCYWFAIYLAIFILLHSCSMTTKRDQEYARQINLKAGHHPQHDSMNDMIDTAV